MQEDVAHRGGAGVGVVDLPAFPELVLGPQRIAGIDRERPAGNAEDRVHLRVLEAEHFLVRVEPIDRDGEPDPALDGAQRKDLSMLALERLQPGKVPARARQRGLLRLRRAQRDRECQGAGERGQGREKGAARRTLRDAVGHGASRLGRGLSNLSDRAPAEQPGNGGA